MRPSNERGGDDRKSSRGASTEVHGHGVTLKPGSGAVGGGGHIQDGSESKNVVWAMRRPAAMGWCALLVSAELTHPEMTEIWPR